MKKKTNRLLSILLCCVMLIGLLPTVALAASYPGAANISIDSTNFSENAYYKNGDTTSFSGTAGDYNAWYEAATGTLHLNNFTGTGKINCSSANDLTIELAGTNTLTVTLAQDGDNQAINSSGLITFTGNGSLTVNMTNSGASGKNTAIYGAKGIAVSGSAELTASVQGGVYDYGIYGGGGVTISENATVNVTTNVTVDGGTGRAIYCDEGAISISSANPTTVTLTGSENNGTNYGILNIAGNSGTPNNGNITLSGTGKVTVQYQSGPFAYGIISWPTDTAKNPNGVISLTNANVDITNCDQGIVAISQTRGSAAADITINNSTLTIDSTKESPEGVLSAQNGILIQDSAVTISSKGGGLSTKHSSYTNTSTYGIDIKGTSTVALTSKTSGGYMLYANVADVCDFDLSGGGSVTLKDVNEHSADMMVNTYIKLGAATTVNDTKGTKHSTEKAYSYGKNDGPLVFTGNYTVTFNNNGGTGSMDNAYASGSYALPTCTFTPPASKVFKAWSVSDTEYAVGASITVNANTTVKAVWQNAYTVSFNNNGGTGAMDAVSVPVGDYTLPSCTFTAPDGKAFSGWSTTSNGAVISGPTYNVTQNTELYAIWIQPAEISTLTATLSGFTAGATVDSVTATAGAATYTVTIKQWQHTNSVWNYSDYSTYPKMSSADTFAAGEQYAVGVNFKPVSPNKLATSPDATINGEEGLIGASEDGGKTYYAVLTAPSVPVPSAAVSDVTIRGTKDNAISNTVVTVTLTNDTFANPLSGDWITNLPAGLTQSVARTGDTTATITVSGTPTATSTVQMAITIPAEQLVTSDSNLTVTANANAKYNVAAPTWTVAITGGAGMSTTGNANQTVEQNSAITDVVYTAADGYYFPTNYSVAAQNGIIVTRDSHTQITVSGTPTANTTITLAPATQPNEYIDFLTTNNNVCFAETDESGFMRVNLFGNGKAMKLPLVYRTDNLDLKFDGWYTAEVGGEKVTEDTVFNGYTILYDHWSASNIDSGKIINSITIPNSALVNGYTENDYINASETLSLAGVVSSKNYAVYNGLNAYGSQVTGAETIDTSKDYSVVTSIKLQDGYYFAPNISLTAQHGVRAGVTYRAIVDGIGVTTNTWNSLATSAEICINFPAGGNNVGFTTEPVGGTVNENEPYNFTWGVSGQPTAAELQMKNGSEWAKADDLNINQTNGTISAQTGTKTYRILVTYGNSGSIYCNEFTVTWLAAVQNTFSMSPASGTVKNGTDYAFTWACVQTPATANLERKNGNSWDDLGTATSRKITYDNNYADTTQTFRIKATMAGGSAFYSDEFTVTYKATPLFAVQPGNGKVAVGSTYTVNYTVDKADGDGEFDGNNSVLQKKNGGNWDNVSTSVYATQAVVPAQNSAKTETYRVGIKIGSNELLYSEEFSVQWIDDYTFELDQNSLAWGSIAKSDYYGEYAKMIKIMHTGTKTGTLKYDTPTNFGVYYWDGPSYDTLTFTPKDSLAAGTYNEDVNVWVTSDGSNELEKKTVNLSITVVDETPTYTISFNPGEGTGSMASVLNNTGTYELPACTFTAPDGKEFKAWQVNGSAEKNPGETIPVTGNTVLTALWKDLPVVSGYTITFEAGGGSGTMAPVAGASGNYHLPSCTFTAPANKQFKAWQVNGQGEYQPGAVITVTSNTTVTAIWRDIPTEYWTVKVNGLYICGAAYNHSIEQKVEKGQPMSTIIVTANDGYYFADPLQVSGAENGITVTRVSYTQVTVSGTPTADVYNIGFSASSKQKESAPTNLYFEATGADTGNLCNLENGVTYAVSGAATAEFTATDSTYALTNVTEGTLNVVKKASDPNTKLDSDAHDYTVGKHATIPNVTSFNCTDANNNNGQLWNVSIEMEYQKEGDNGWTPGTGSNITGLTPGTYYVRYKASNINLAGNPKTITIAAYNVPALTGTVTITGDAKFGEQLTADVSGITNNTGTLSYQWKRGNTDIGTNSATYTIVEADIGSTIKVVVTSSVESGSITSNATTTVEKADGPAAPTGLAGVAPTSDGGSDGKITGTATTMEYSTDSSFTNPTGTVCPDTETTGLTAGTYYVRVKETATHKAGANATVTVPAYVAAPTYAVTVTNGTGSGNYAENASVTITANAPEAGKQFKEWTGADGLTFTSGSKTSATATFTMPAQAVSVTATYENIPVTTYAVTVTDGTATPSGAQAAGTSITITADAAPAGKQFKEWTGADGLTFTSGSKTTATATFTMPAQAVSVTATYENIPVTTYTITFNANGGSVTPASAETGADGKLTSLPTPTRSGSYSFNGWYTAASGGTKVITSTIFNANTTIYAQWTYTGGGGGGGGGGYTPATYSVTVDKADNGSISVSPKSASKGTTVTITVKPDTGYELDTLKVVDKNGDKVKLTEKDGKYTFTMPASKVTVTGTFAEIEQPVVNPFTDVKESDYYYEAVQWALKNGITDGTSATTFSPNANCTRAQIVTFLWRAAGSPEPVVKTCIFTDVSADAYYAKAVQWAYEQGITGGTSATTYSPDATCTRGQMATFLCRMANGKPVDSTSAFTDVEAGKYYTEAVQWAVENGITNGTSATTFSPDTTCTRAQMVTFLYRYFVK